MAPGPPAQPFSRRRRLGPPMRPVLLAALLLLTLAAVPAADADPLCDAGFRSTYEVENQGSRDVYVAGQYVGTFRAWYTVESQPC
jgi:hypothetical protein